MAPGEECLQGNVSRVILEISQTSRPRDILKIRLDREQEALTGAGVGVLHIVSSPGIIAKLWQTVTSDQRDLPVCNYVTYINTLVKLDIY